MIAIESRQEEHKSRNSSNMWLWITRDVPATCEELPIYSHPSILKLFTDSWIIQTTFKNYRETDADRSDGLDNVRCRLLVTGGQSWVFSTSGLISRRQNGTSAACWYHKRSQDGSQNGAESASKSAAWNYFMALNVTAAHIRFHIRHSVGRSDCCHFRAAV